MQEKVSIIVPIYNSERYIYQCVDSIRKQTYENIEIILVDNNSTDKSIEICSQLMQQDNRIHVIQEKKNGVSNARNRGIEKSTGDYILFVDSDDWIERDTINSLISIYNREEEIDVIIYEIKKNYMKSNTNEEKKFKKNIELQENIYELGNIISKIIEYETINSPVNKLYKAKIIKEHNIRFDSKLQIAEDLLFNINYFKYVKNLYIVNKEFYNYRIENEESLTHKYIENKYEQLMYVNNEMTKWIKKNYSTEIYKKCVYLKFKYAISCIRDMGHKECKYTHKEKIQYIKNIRKDNRFVITTAGWKILVLSIIYSIMPAKLLLLFVMHI